MSASAVFFLFFFILFVGKVHAIAVRSFSHRLTAVRAVCPALNRTSEHMLERDRLCVLVYRKKGLIVIQITEDSAEPNELRLF